MTGLLGGDALTKILDAVLDKNTELAEAKLQQGKYIAEKSLTDKLFYQELTVSADWCNTANNQDLNFSSFISKIYVDLDILLARRHTKIGDGDEEEFPKSKFDDILKHCNGNIVILGDPGADKTTL